jgi:hypothetical protein
MLRQRLPCVGGNPADNFAVDWFVDLERGPISPQEWRDNSDNFAGTPVCFPESTTDIFAPLETFSTGLLAAPKHRGDRLMALDGDSIWLRPPRRGIIRTIRRAGTEAFADYAPQDTHQIRDLSYGALVGACRGLILSGGCASYLAYCSGSNALGWAVCAGLTARFMVTEARYYRDTGAFFRAHQVP